MENLTQSWLIVGLTLQEYDQKFEKDEDLFSENYSISACKGNSRRDP